MLRSSSSIIRGLGKFTMDKAKLVWVKEYSELGISNTNDFAKSQSLLLADAAIQVKEEAHAPRMAVMGLTSTKDQPLSNKAVFLASYESKEAYGEHKEREAHKQFVKNFSETWPNSSDTDMVGTYTGPTFHLEKPGESNTCQTYSIVVIGKCKSAEAASELVGVMKAHGTAQLAAEEGALRFDVIPPSCNADLPPTHPRDDDTVRWVEAWKTASDYDAHKTTPHLKDLMPKLKALTAAIAVYDYPNTQHYAK